MDTQYRCKNEERRRLVGSTEDTDGNPISPKLNEPPPQARGLQKHDRPLLQEMREAIRDGKADNPWAATALVVDRAKGAGTEWSKRERLRAGYVHTFQSSKAGK